VRAWATASTDAGNGASLAARDSPASGRDAVVTGFAAIGDRSRWQTAQNGAPSRAARISVRACACESQSFGGTNSGRSARGRCNTSAGSSGGDRRIDGRAAGTLERRRLDPRVLPVAFEPQRQPARDQALGDLPQHLRVVEPLRRQLGAREQRPQAPHLARVRPLAQVAERVRGVVEPRRVRPRAGDAQLDPSPAAVPDLHAHRGNITRIRESRPYDHSRPCDCFGGS
jgi:hypothetical protein